jgi:predicted amidohydrolase
MKAALAVHRVVHDVQANLSAILHGISQASEEGADLVLFPEAALTGLINDDRPSHDLPLGVEVPGPVMDQLAEAAARGGIWLGLGLLERERTRLYDAAFLIAPEGRIGLHYRRMQLQWHGPQADPSVYRQGKELPVVRTPLGTFAFLICGDLFDDPMVERFQALGSDWLLCPLARCFCDGAIDQQRWEEEELPDYVERVRRAGTTALMVNYLAGPDLLGGAFGGAWVVRPDGKVLASLPLGKEGMLLVDLGGPAP